MQITLNEFERQINKTILSRGLSYFKKGRVHKPVELSPGKYEFSVEGSADYTVRISLKNGVISDYICDCPYDWGPVCKHVAAVIYYLQQDEPELNRKITKKKNTAKKKRKTLTDQVNELLERTSHEELEQFIRTKTERDRTFRNMFLASFAHLNTDESKSLYVKQVRSILSAAADRHGFINWSAAGRVGVAVDQLLKTAQKQVDTKHYKSAVFISTAVMEQMTKALQYADDSNGDIGGSINAAFDILYQVAQAQPNEQIRKLVLEYCFKAFDKEIFAGWDWHIGVLQIAAVLIKTEKETERIFDQIDRAKRPGYEQEMAQSIKYEILLKTKGAAAADNYLEKNITNSKLRRIALQKALDYKEFAKANQLAQYGVKYDRQDRPGLAKEWYDWLLKIAQAQGKTEKIIEYARYLLIDSFRNEQDYYQILKTHVNPADWTEFIEKVIEEISNKQRWVDLNRIANIFIREKWWHRLLEVVKKNSNLRTIEHYEKYLAEDYSDDVVDIYAKGIMKYMENNVGRKHYQYICRYLRRMIKLGGREQTNKTIARLREIYPNRRALMEELHNV